MLKTPLNTTTTTKHPSITEVSFVAADINTYLYVDTTFNWHINASTILEQNISDTESKPMIFFFFFKFHRIVQLTTKIYISGEMRYLSQVRMCHWWHIQYCNYYSKLCVNCNHIVYLFVDNTKWYSNYTIYVTHDFNML